jgi:hypothetical protein
MVVCDLRHNQSKIRPKDIVKFNIWFGAFYLQGAGIYEP